MNCLNTQAFIFILVLFLTVDGFSSWNNRWKRPKQNKSTLNRKCKSPNGDVANAEYIEHNIGLRNREYRTYTCKEGYAMNLDNPKRYKFHCRLNDKGNYIWKYNSTLQLKDVTCKLKSKCSRPPKTPPNMERIDHMRYKMNKASNKYFAGDTIEYKCKDGYEVMSDFGYYDYSVGNDTAIIECNEKGLWNGQETQEIIITTCEEIQCNAERFNSTRNGNITNYMDVYPYLGEIMLTCDPGYRPINDISSITCTDLSSFEISKVKEFGCEEIRCPLPTKPKNGYSRYTRRNVGSKMSFFCHAGYELIGDETWTCNEDGKWDHNCVICSRGDTYCRPPCIPFGATMNSQDTDYELGSVITFTCTNGIVYGGSTNRTCLRNRDWSGTEIDCTGDSLFDANVGFKFMSAMGHINENKTTKDTPEGDVAESRSMHIGQEGGVDVYILLDVSASITTTKKFDETKRFIKALLPEIGISSASSGTRLALITFASKMDVVFNQHYDVDDEEVFTSYEEPQAEIDKLTRESLVKAVGKGTAISNALSEVRIDVETKMGMFSNGLLTRKAQQILILLSDGRYTTGGYPDEMATKLKQRDVEIYSIAVGKKGDGIGFKAMKDIASVIEDEQHFFAINERTLDEVLKLMISREPAEGIQCGLTKPHKTLFNDESVSYDREANEHAWPWMVRLVNEGGHICGGSLINKRWILTAAHCFNDKVVTRIEFKRIDIKQANHNGFEKLPERHVIHPNFNKDKIPGHLYDVALIKVAEDLPDFDDELLPICIWNKTETTEKAYNDLFKPGTYGVVTGWGHDKKGQTSDILKQLQMPIQNDDKCAKTPEQQTEFNKTVMFCAGGKEINNVKEVVDACKGDSGGPFVVKHPSTDKKNTFIQIGIVSFGFGCREKDRYGIYTRLTPDIVKWIHDTTKPKPLV